MKTSSFWIRRPWSLVANRTGASSSKGCRSPFSSPSRVLVTSAAPAFDEETDVLIVGSGAAGLTGALRAQSHGLKSVIVEKHAQVGGSSAYSGGGIWIPNNPLAQRAGVTDSLDEAMKYMEAVVGEVGPSSSHDRKLRFLTHGPRMISFLLNIGVRLRMSPGCPDYYPKAPGAMNHWGRSIEPDIFDNQRLGGGSVECIRQRPGRTPPLFTYEACALTRMDYMTLLRVLLRSIIYTWWHKQTPVTMGKSLVGQLLLLNQQANTRILCNTALAGLICAPDDTVLGARTAEHPGGRERTIRAKRGILLSAGGFARNQQMRQKWGPSPANAQWTSAPPGDVGDAITAGMTIGAATALMDEAWWGPTLTDPVVGMHYFALTERARPFSFIVDSSGARFMNEAKPYVDAGHDQYARHQQVPAIPGWLIFDLNHRKRYTMCSLLPRQQPPAAGVKAGYIYQAGTIEELAGQIGVDVAGLQSTVCRFNQMARVGADLDFGRGDDCFDNYFGDPAVHPNPNLGPVEKAPFYAIPVVPGDLGTKGGLLTDDCARVLRDDGDPIRGLYAAGNSSASVMGRTYPGAGSTLGPALTFAFVAADQMAK